MLLALLLPLASASDWSLKLLTDAANNQGAFCLDGTAPGYYIRPGVGEDARKFKLHFKGGGWCMSDEDCYGRSQGWLGSSKHWGPAPATGTDPSHNPSEGSYGLLNNETGNPTQNWTAIFVEYCDGTSYTSERANPVKTAKGTIYYRGKRVLDALITDWLTNEGMSDATDVIMSGTSAGGLTTYLHAEYFRTKLAPATKLFAVPDAGFFLDLPNTEGVHAWKAALNGGFVAWNGTGNTPASCLAAYPSAADRWHCHFPNYVLPHITTVPFFVMNSLYDTFHIGNILQLGCSPIAPGAATHAPPSLLGEDTTRREFFGISASGSSRDIRLACNASELQSLQDYRDAFRGSVTGILKSQPKNGAGLTGCLQHEEICRDKECVPRYSTTHVPRASLHRLPVRSSYALC
jgi:hypothetical protein